MTRPTLEVTGLLKSFPPSEEQVVSGVDLAVAPGERLALIGESGSGKTTLLRMVAGFEAPTAGRIVINGDTVNAPGRAVPPERRRVGLVFQETALFPHLSIRDNVGFGLTAKQPTRGAEIDRLLSMVGLDHLGERFPHEVSGGQAQRAALARALARRPTLLLLDEPFNNLDVIVKQRLIGEIRELLTEVGMTTIFVTHEREDAYAFADRVAIMRDGRLLQTGDFREVYRRPADPYVAAVLGPVNLLPAVRQNGSWRTCLGEVAARSVMVGGDQSTVAVRPNELLLAPDEGGGVAATVCGCRFFGAYCELAVTVAEGGLTPTAALVLHVDPDTRAEIGDSVRVGLHLDDRTSR